MSTPFIVFDRATGAIKRTGQCPEKMVALQPGFGESVMIGQANDLTHRVDRTPEGIKSIVRRTDVPDLAAQYVAKGLAPEFAARLASRGPQRKAAPRA